MTLTTMLAACAVASACGGGDDGPDTGFDCLFANCKNSQDIQVSDLSARYEVTQEGTRVTAVSSVGYRYNLLTVVRVTGGDTLTLSSGVQSREMHPTDASWWHASASLDGLGESPTVSVDFKRGTQVERGTVTLPKVFSIVSPTGAVVLKHSDGQLLATLTTLASDHLVTQVNGNCRRADGTQFPINTTLTPAYQSAQPTGHLYRISVSLLDSEIAFENQQAQPGNLSAVDRCELTLQWRSEAYGTTPAGMHPSSSIVGVTKQSMPLSYLAQQ
ncbi:hypothetical protein DZC73_04140 [Albitalea terrae]|uniref:Uncharacterized protein n=2 Tax=Piscinibacter terrae TaxID=2496871 RepID=A0A3N7HYN8_9BURK|nr:hypothetical protein DZC73_04140 [Albitalea terrae]